MKNIYFLLTEEFNTGRVRAVLSSGQAVVWYGLSLMSKDGDWIVRDDEESLQHILSVLAQHGARYRFGAPLSQKWLKAGWSSHFEFFEDGLRVRTDFVSIPPRLTLEEIDSLWRSADNPVQAVVPKELLLKIKLTQRAKDYPILAELSKALDSPEQILQHGRDAAGIIAAAASVPQQVLAEAIAKRPALRAFSQGEEELEVLLFREQQLLMKADTARMARYQNAAGSWAKAWPKLAAEIETLDLAAAHARVCEDAQQLLPTVLS